MSIKSQEPACFKINLDLNSIKMKVSVKMHLLH
jgi:hypothetical protein